MRTFGYVIISGIITVNMEDNKQNQWEKKKKREFASNAKTRNFNMKKGKTCDIINNAMAPLKRVIRVYSESKIYHQHNQTNQTNQTNQPN